MDVDGEDGNDNGEGDEDHGEHQVLADERDDLGRGRDDLLDHQQEDSEGDEHGSAQGDFLAAVGRQVEDQDGEEGQADAGDDEEESVEERQPADEEGVGDERVVAALVHPQPTAARRLDDLPLAIVKIVPFVYMNVLQKDVHLEDEG